MALAPLICDTGSGVIKAGFAGEHFPRLNFPGIVGRPMLRFDEDVGDVHLKDIMLGTEAAEVRAMLQVSYPVANGVIQNWDDMELVWDHTFKTLGANCSDHVVVQTEAALNPLKNREKMCEYMIEKFGFAGVNVGVQAILALNAQGLNTGLVVDSGDGVTHLVPIFEGFVQPAHVARLNIAGRHITEQLVKLLQQRGYLLNSSADFETAASIKQKMCYVAYDVEKEKRLATQTTTLEKRYQMPDTREVKLSSERFMAPEILFNPSLFNPAGSDQKGLPEFIYDTIMRTDIDQRRTYFGRVVLSGGTTMFPGMSSRVERELGVLTSKLKDMRINVEDPPRRKFMVYLGASHIAKHFHEENVADWYISKKEYEERGAQAIHRLVPTNLS
mmetsp:Transcript_14198/g.30707  ORF Transcript_14198/g.30707 Transcript_14198/m.30707 type:complete len:387 (-) Transcript_14198:138-1298(-)|eukprot:CAMPEP_0204337296 /NCGR_PEP_ID=MMETSP0469-20131031/20195_1 /ASSEMBLY_ACC=CAM_ASM_000384 /TAXON_ID=2969 /ORGANISM="Oxyrrhis marina" /LENGTH=386 /DNA_ID=CAMNT_0051321301 /DNA_START=28 /DNA_END=1188 /DNA_ORIENTATION=-